MIGWRHPFLDRDEGGEHHRGEGEGEQRDRVAPARFRRPHEAVDEGAHAERRGRRAADVEFAGVALGLGQVAGRQGDEDDADRDVDEEAPTPGDPGGQHAAEDEADAGPGAGDGGVEGDRAGALGALGEGDREQRQGRGRGDRGADALDRAGGEQPGLRLGEPAEHRGGGEDGDADHEHLAASEQVAGAGAEQQQAAEGERVDVLDPRQGGRGEAEVGADVGERGDHHRRVEDDHQVAAEDDREDHRGVGCPCVCGAAGVGPPQKSGSHAGKGPLGEGGRVLKWRYPPPNREGASGS